MEKSNTAEPVATWRRIGTVVGNAGTAQFTFILQQFQARVGDIVALGMEVPDAGYAGRSSIYVWARITGIQRFNPFFPFEAAQEIAGQGISLEDTVLSNTRDQLEAEALILGATSEDDLRRLFPLTYPVKPAATVFHPPADAIRELLIGGRGEGEDELNVRIGTLIARSDVEVTLDAAKLVARHMAILAMTGGGKTVAARRILRELAEKGYPLVILDPHGDYIGLTKAAALLQKENPNCKVRVFYPELLVQKDGEDLVGRLIGQMTTGLTDAQHEYLRGLFERKPAREGEQAFKYIGRLVETQTADLKGASAPSGAPAGNWKPTVYVTGRNLRIVLDRLGRMEKTSDAMRKKLKNLPWEALPSPFSQPEEIVRPNQVSVIYLGGYDHVTQCSIVALTMETLFEYRADLSGRIPPFFIAVEEAHTFIPSAREGTGDAVSLPIVRRIITEGRKFGTGLLLVSQRPSRLDETIVSQCNSFLILRLVNPRDQNFVRSIMENLTDADARMLPGFGPGQGIVSGQVVRFPLPVSVEMDKELLATEIGDENFFEQVGKWKPDPKSAKRATLAQATATVDRNRTKRKF